MMLQLFYSRLLNKIHKLRMWRSIIMLIMLWEKIWILWWGRERGDCLRGGEEGREEKRKRNDLYFGYYWEYDCIYYYRNYNRLCLKRVKAICWRRQALAKSKRDFMNCHLLSIHTVKRQRKINTALDKVKSSVT